MDLLSMRNFKKDTGQCLWSTLIDFLRVYAASEGKGALDRMSDIYHVVDFETASYIFFHLIEREHKVPLEEIQDAMFRVGWLVNSTDSDMAEPWPLVMALLAHEINSEFNEVSPPKKSDT